MYTSSNQTPVILFTSATRSFLASSSFLLLVLVALRRYLIPSYIRTIYLNGPFNAVTCLQDLCFYFYPAVCPCPYHSCPCVSLGYGYGFDYGYAYNGLFLENSLLLKSRKHTHLVYTYTSICDI